MRSIREIFVVGHGPSSSHTMGPAFACDYILNKYKNIKSIKVTLFGSLALTGKGHLTDYIVDLKFKNIDHDIVFDSSTVTDHPNVMLFEIVDINDISYSEKVYSLGGGTIQTEEGLNTNNTDIYHYRFLKDILSYCADENISLVDYVMKFEKEGILDYYSSIYDEINASIARGLTNEGILPGKLKLPRKAKEMYAKMQDNHQTENIEMNVAIASFAVSEENAAGGVVVIAPTCGSAGVIPGCLTYLKMNNYSKVEIVKGLLVAGLIGMIAKTNASISGAECGCQAEIGVACAMGAAMIATVMGLDNDNIAQSAEIAMEHSLGLTCDPVDGYVQIPCIERCAVFALKAINVVTLAKLIPASKARVSFDDSIQTMFLTGKDLQEGYRETSISGLAKQVK